MHHNLNKMIPLSNIRIQNPHALFCFVLHIDSSRNMSAIALRKGIVTTKSTTCWICGKTFTSTSLCNRHLASHSNFRPYQCRLCDKAFHRSDNCRTHELSHNAKTEFNCRKCGRSYRWRCNRTQHEKKCTGSM